MPIKFEKDSQDIVTLTFDAPGAPVNTMTEAWQTAFADMVQRLEREKAQTRGVILASGKKTFFAGAELKDVLKFGADDGPKVFAWIESVKKRMRTLEKLGVPVVAALEGTALGGGWEIALCAHCRLVMDDEKIQLGLPEVTLGLLPGAGGVTKMTRLLGLQGAFPYLVEGKTMKPRQAAELGLVQGLAASRDDLFRMAREWIAANPSPKQPWDDEAFRMPGGGPSNPKVSQMLSIAPAMVVEKTRGLYPAPKAIMAAMVEGAYVDVDTALRIESRYLAKLAVGAVAKNLITLFFNRTAIKSGGSRPEGYPKWKASKVGILGAGMMGGGIAYANAIRAVPCVLKDVTLEKAEAGKSYTDKLLEKRKKEKNPLLLIKATDNVKDLAGCDLIIEAVFEKRDIKAQATKEAEPMLAKGGIFASNTSTLPISGLAQAFGKPENFIGLHFFSPVDKMELVEIIKGAKTSPETLAKAYDYVLQIGKTPIVVNDSRGFYTSRTFGTFVQEGCAMLAEGVPAAAIENAARQAGMPVGPLEVIDQTSMSLSMAVMEQTIADLKAEGQPLPPEHPGQKVIIKMVRELKRPGRAAGGGFYEYPKEGRKFLWPGLAQAFGAKNSGWDLQELKDRILYRQAIETARCFSEGVLETAHDGNIGSIYGIGFPAWTGGALQFINSVGPKQFAKRAEELAAKHGERFAPPELLLDKAARGELFR
ncbi:MAG TPA: 3-hydroxyacyl-CoA dehydrogenase NAD-binding domain-containing protein [Burkholderiales bacterium]|jgi:3-hydroxyacyl-CoA dehydrogenase/enoyl-CoA hydratase/3-hydroxybutyryl-CoA epimerase|nr:3-hydroxyacyl-CoA dehydrogenase NAD-binding domain-containing protein [Burkholderiales bacterium]